MRMNFIFLRLIWWSPKAWLKIGVSVTQTAVVDVLINHYALAIYNITDNEIPAVMKYHTLPYNK